MKFVLILVLCMFSCSATPPKKTFETRTYIPEYEIGCVYYRISDVEMRRTCAGDHDYPPNLILIDLGKMPQSLIGGLINEIGYQNLLIKECAAWR